MDDINFLGNKNDKKKKKEKRKGSVVEWSEPVREKTVVFKESKESWKPGKLFSWLALPKKVKKSPPLPREQSALVARLASLPHTSHSPFEARGKNAKLPEREHGERGLPIKTNGKRDSSDKNKIELSRQEVLRAIKDNGGRKVIKEPLMKKEFKQDKKLTFLLWWAKLWRRKSHEVEKGGKEAFKFPRVDKIINKNGDRDRSAVFPENDKKPIIEIKKKAEKKASLSSQNKENEKEWEGSHILETNLIKGEFVASFQLKKNLIFLLIFIIFACLAVAGIYGGLIFRDKQKMEQTVVNSDKIDNLYKTIEQLEGEIEPMSMLGDNLKLAGELLDNHIYWTNFFKFLEDITIPDVFYNGISFNNSGEYSLSARTKNFRTILDQVNIMRLNEYIKEVKVDGGEVSVAEAAGQESESQKKGEETAGVDFALKFSVDPVLFTKGPRISNIEPLDGAVGQYITISGINFKSYNKSKSFIKFFDAQSDTFAPADTNFPEECQNDWWRNSYIIVKVPSIMPGNWRIIAANEDGETEYSADFQVTAGSPGPGICLLDPSYGFEEQVIDVYGDNFGQEQGFGSIEYNGGEVGKVSYWSDKKITVEAPIKVQLGPLKIKTTSGGLSNSLLYKRLY